MVKRAVVVPTKQIISRLLGGLEDESVDRLSDLTGPGRGVAPRARPLPIQWSCYCFSGDKLVEIVIGPLPAPTYLDPLASVFLSFSGQGSK